MQSKYQIKHQIQLQISVTTHEIRTFVFLQRYAKKIEYSTTYEINVKPSAQNY
jgi:hypothetical protein